MFIKMAKISPCTRQKSSVNYVIYLFISIFCPPKSSELWAVYKTRRNIKTTKNVEFHRQPKLKVYNEEQKQIKNGILNRKHQS